MKTLTMQQQKFVYDAADRIAFQCDAPYTVRRGLAAMRADPELLAECNPTFGMSFIKLRDLMFAWTDVDQEYFPIV